MISVYALVIGISQSQTLLTSTIEEKSNRLVEVLLSSISPWELMAGKIAGLVGATLTLMGIWALGGAYMVHRQGWEALVRDEMFGWFLVYLVLSVSFYSTFIAAIGSAVTELKEAQNLMVPVWICIMVPMILMFFVGQHPDLWWVRVLSFVPFFTPFLMVNSLASVVPPGPLEIALSVAVMVLACWGATYLAARVFRVGILLYGKPATPRELWRWLRTGRGALRRDGLAMISSSDLRTDIKEILRWCHKKFSLKAYSQAYYPIWSKTQSPIEARMCLRRDSIF